MGISASKPDSILESDLVSQQRLESEKKGYHPAPSLAELPMQLTESKGIDKDTSTTSHTKGIIKEPLYDDETRSKSTESTRGSPDFFLGCFEDFPRHDTPTSWHQHTAMRSGVRVFRPQVVFRAGHYDGSQSSSSVTSTQSAPTEPVKCPRPGTRHLSSGDAVSADQKHLYDMRTWEMYLRITEARKKNMHHGTSSKGRHIGAQSSPRDPSATIQSPDIYTHCKSEEDLIFHLE